MEQQIHDNIFKPTKDTEVLIPFGPVIAYKKLSAELVTYLNSHIDDTLPDHSPYLVGKVSKEIRFNEKISDVVLKELSGFIFEYYRFTFERARMRPDSLPKEGFDYHLNTINGWFVRQYAGEYNPLHIHTNCSLSCVGYLSLPEKFEEECAEDYKDHHPSHGHIQFTNGVPGWHESSGFQVKPRVGDFFLFPAKLLHAVYPFYSEGERRSFSMNFEILQVDKSVQKQQPLPKQHGGGRRGKRKKRQRK